MAKNEIDSDKIYKHWISTSERDHKAMLHLFDSGDYNWALVIGHLVIEKLLKAKIVKITGNHAPFAHDLRRLAKKTDIEFNSKHIEWLDTITTFNLIARYDSYKENFYQKCDYDFSENG